MKMFLKMFFKHLWCLNVLKLMCGICCVSSMNIVKTTEFKWLNNICELYLKETVLMKVMAQLNEIQMPELPWQFVERKMKRFREGGTLIWIYAIELENTQVTVSLERPKGYCLSGNKECTRKGSIKLIVSVLGELGLTLGDNITELSINVSLALVGIIRSQKPEDRWQQVRNQVSRIVKIAIIVRIETREILTVRNFGNG